MSMVHPVVIAAGGTGGHIVPALAVAQVLSASNVPVVWVGTRAGLEAQLVTAAGIDIRWIDIAGLRGKGIMSLLAAPFKLVAACWQSIGILREVQASAVLGMGGYVSGPVGLAAVCTRRPLVLHEQNAVAGTTNRYLSYVATRVFSAMPDVFRSNVKTTVAGNPVAANMARRPAQQTEPVVDNVLHVLVVGGSRGAHHLNEVVPAAIAKFLPQHIHVWHQTGAADRGAVQSAYAEFCNAPEPIRVDAFIDDMAAAYRWADIVICRSGAMTVTELGAVGVASILVPFPHAVDNHQTLNARYLSDAGAAILVPQNEFDIDTLAEMLSGLIQDRGKLEHMAQRAHEQYLPNAAEQVAAALIEVSR